MIVKAMFLIICLQIDLESYYKAIKMYLMYGKYPDGSSKNFKRLIRDQAKNYKFHGEELYHTIGSSLKQVIIKADDRFARLQDAHLKIGTCSNDYTKVE